MATQVRLRHTIITRGQSVGEEGFGYSYLSDGQEVCGNVSVATRGYYEGEEEEAWGELADGWSLAESQSGELLAYEGEDVRRGHTAGACIALGVLAVVRAVLVNGKPSGVVIIGGEVVGGGSLIGGGGGVEPRVDHGTPFVVHVCPEVI